MTGVQTCALPISVSEEGKEDKTVRTAKAAEEILLYSPAIKSMNCAIVKSQPKEKIAKTKKHKSYIANPELFDFE